MSPQDAIMIVEHSQEHSLKVKQAERNGVRRRNSSTCECSVEKRNGI